MQKNLTTNREIKEAQEHRDVLLALKAILASPQGKILFRYLFKNLDVACVPEQGLDGAMLMERIGFLRTGNEIFKLACEADAKTSSEILCEVERERYAELYSELDDDEHAS